ncbi:MLO-like protein 6 isoform X1 [Pyrus x bretschneideri]|uniref:MLO-like protein 6 isoform X1 n=1 Tax=Pyrus x bretschneideri TaxID=225117 RepID=UPI00202EF235|nr:MLO-like protein 6 isoform X1 [Pyrus x bretschneideri]
MAELAKERTLEETPTWAVAVVCFVLLAVSIFIEHTIHLIGKWLARKDKRALVEALEKIKSELMLLGFLSLLLTVLQGPISDICISKSIGATWHPCKYNKSSKSGKNGRKLLEIFNPRRRLAVKGYDYCTEKGKVAFVSSYGIHQLHIFIFVLAVFHVLYCILTLGLGRYKMRTWKVWEKETKSIDYRQFYNDSERFRFARDTSFGRRHLNFWSKSPVSLWIVSFFRQFSHSVTKVDYLTLRHGFIMAHLAPGSESTFDFQKYINRSVEEDFKVIVGISPIIWFSAVLFLLSNTYGWYSYIWLPTIPLIIVLMVGTKLQVTITKMGLRIQESGDVVKGAPLVQPSDHLFWFGSPRFMLYLLHFVLFQNAFQMAFFAWSTYEFGITSCFHRSTEDIVVRLSFGVIVQVLCSYVTLPLYALVTQMGSTMKPTVFNEGVAAALKDWHHKAKKNTKHSRHSPSTTPFSSMPPSPLRGTSPVHLLHNHNYRSNDDQFYVSPSQANIEMGHWGTEGSSHSPNNNVGPSDGDEIRQMTNVRDLDQEPGSTELPRSPLPVRRTQSQHEVAFRSSDFSFAKAN